MVDLNQFFCPNKSCKEYGKKNCDNIGTRGTYGKQSRQMLYCRTCKTRFSETKGTVFAGCKYSKETIQKIIKVVGECNGVRATARILDLSKDGVNRIIKIAGDHCETVMDNLLNDLCLSEVQLDELWSFIKKTMYERRGT